MFNLDINSIFGYGNKQISDFNKDDTDTFPSKPPGSFKSALVEKPGANADPGPTRENIMGLGIEAPPPAPDTDEKPPKPYPNKWRAGVGIALAQIADAIQRRGKTGAQALAEGIGGFGAGFYNPKLFAQMQRQNGFGNQTNSSAKKPQPTSLSYTSKLPLANETDSPISDGGRNNEAPHKATNLEKILNKINLNRSNAIDQYGQLNKPIDS